MNNKLEVIGIDHGWSMMKTISQVFVTGVKSIVDKAKEKGRSALYRLSEFLGIKKRLLDIRENVRGAIKTTDKDIAKTELLAKGFREAGQTVTNAFRTFADKARGGLFTERAETSHYKGGACPYESSEKDACINGDSFGRIHR